VVLVLAACLLVKPMAPSYGVCADPTGININGKSAKLGQVVRVNSREVVIRVYFESEATDYRVCEDPTFEGCKWRQVPGGERPVLEIKYTLSEGSGIKTIYFQAKRQSTIASVVKLQFDLA
jgi:hypothetical protein